MAQKKSTAKKKSSARGATRKSKRAAKRPTARAAARPRVRERRLVRGIMTVDIETLKPTDSAAEAARRMRDLDVGAIPICEEGGRLVGIVTDRDITIRVTAEGLDPDTVPLENCYSTVDLAIARPDWTVEQAAEVMAQHQVRRLPVVDEGVLVGMVSLGDLATKAPEPESTTKALKEISQPAAPRTSSHKAIA